MASSDQNKGQTAQNYYRKCAEELKNGSISHLTPGEGKSSKESLPGVVLSSKHSLMENGDEETPKKRIKAEESNMLSDMNLPKDIKLNIVMKRRAKEIKSLLEAVQTKAPPSLHQQVPRHMRRRAVSQNKRRLPKRLQWKYTKESEKQKSSKRPSRKFRRRPRNLLTEYIRRQRKAVWLDTHIWFAKRFKMEELWGYKIAVHPCDKSVRAAYRSCTQYSLLHDISYFNCIELIGTRNDLVKKLSEITSPETGLTFKAKLYEDGCREGKTILYHPKQYPFGAIGPVKFMWRPKSEPSKTGTATENNDTQQLWIWTHPSCHEEIKKLLIELFCLTPIVSDSTKASAWDLESTPAIASDSNKEVSSQADNSKSNYFNRTPVYSSDTVSMVLLKDTLVRFSLTGPQCNLVLSDTLSVTSVKHMKEESTANKWWSRYYSEEAADDLEKRKTLWTKITSSGVDNQWLPASSVIGLVVRDPRILLPVKRMKVEDKKGSAKYVPLADIQKSICVGNSPVWDPGVRDEVTMSKMSDSKVNALRSQSLVPGTPLNLEQEESRIPVIAIQKMGTSDNQGFGQGWDVVLPAGWARPFWIALIYRGARAAGLRELNSIHLEMGKPFFPADFPDTASGKLHTKKEREKLIEKHYRYPPDKRPNFKKLGVLLPFTCPWKELVNEWEEIVKTSSIFESKWTSFPSMDNESYFVLRNRKVLKTLHEFITFKRKDPVQTGDLIQSVLHRLIELGIAYQRALVCVQVCCTSKGVPKRFALLCQPEVDDTKSIRSSVVKAPASDSVEPIHKVSGKPRKEKKHAKKDMEELLKRPEVKGLVSNCSRKLLGFVMNGGYSFTSACGKGIGYCSLLGLLHMMYILKDSDSSNNLVLIRNQNAVQYRFSKLEIVLDF